MKLRRRLQIMQGAIVFLTLIATALIYIVVIQHQTILNIRWALLEVPTGVEFELLSNQVAGLAEHHGPTGFIKGGLKGRRGIEDDVADHAAAVAGLQRDVENLKMDISSLQNESGAIARRADDALLRSTEPCLVHGIC